MYWFYLLLASFGQSRRHVGDKGMSDVSMQWSDSLKIILGVCQDSLR